MRESDQNPSPSVLRAIFGANLRLLCSDAGSITALTARLGINRTQFNRYLSGESFPRPDVLDRICRHFGVDARILTTPLDRMAANGAGPLSLPYLEAWLGPEATTVDETAFPSGFYRFSRQSFMDASSFLQGVVLISRRDGATVLRGFEPREALMQQGLPWSSKARDFRGLVLRQEDGLSILIARRMARTGSFNFLAPVASYDNHLWEGYVTRTVRSQPTGRRISRMVYEYLGPAIGPALRARRNAGFCTMRDLLPHHLRLLQVDSPMF